MPANADPLRRSEMLRYGLPGFVLTLLGVPLYVYLPNYFHDNWQVSLGVIGAALLVTRLLDMVTDPLVGVWSDQWQARIGRRSQMALGALVLLVGLYGLFFPFEVWLQAMPFVYLFAVSSVAFLGWTLMSVPYQALVADLTTDHHAKTRLTLSREGFGLLGVVVVLALPTILSLAPTAPALFEWVWWLVLGGLVVSLSGLLRLDTVQRLDPATATRTSLWQSLYGYRRLWQQHRQAYALMGPYFVNNLANAFPATLFLLFVTHALALEPEAGPLLLVYFACGLLALPFWLWLSKRVGKLAAWRWSMITAVIGFSGLYWVEAGDYERYLLVCAVTGLSLGADMALPASLQADVVQRLREQGMDAASRLFGLWGLLTKLALAVAVGVALPWLEALGLDQATPEAVSALWVFYALIPILLKLFVLLWLQRHSDYGIL
ncbi:MAG: MFS transporter [Hydrogenovibrio sp.]|uniref:MFS transporter n=1 Tax=Hydrogenovibrio sp. TaxID=2065821 RepID=UPI0028709D02|nr:MFS transporter [Hydrogenovibrio sp.]MDR9498803.1 MFS transporter [Hydrogenovibrio sp.]